MIFNGNNPIIYVIFNGELITPDMLSLGNNYYKLDLESFVSEEGLVFPFMKSFMCNSIPDDYFKNPNFNGIKGMKYALRLRKNGLFEDGFVREKEGLEWQLMPKEIKKILIHDEYVFNGVISNIMNRAETPDQFINMLERRLGIRTKLFSVYSIQRLVDYINGKIPFSKIKPRKVKSEFKTVWLK